MDTKTRRKYRRQYYLWRHKEKQEKVPQKKVDAWFEEEFIDDLPRDKILQYLHVFYASYEMKVPFNDTLLWIEEEFNELVHA